MTIFEITKPQNEIIYKNENPERIERQGIQMAFKDYDVEQELQKAKTVTEQVLQKERIARNSDLWLIFLVWLKQGQIKYINHENNHGYFVPIKAMPHILSPSSITRVRRVLNYVEKKYLADDPKVMARRKIREKQFREVLIQ